MAIGASMCCSSAKAGSSASTRCTAPTAKSSCSCAQSGPNGARRSSIGASASRPIAPDAIWCLDFVADQLADGTRFRALTIVDVFSHAALAIEVGKGLGAEHVVASLNRLVAPRQAPRYLFADNGSEFSGRLLDLWAYHHDVRVDFSRPGKPTDNSFVETFNGSLRDECLNVHWFETMEDAETGIEAWRRDYNESRPHMALEGRPPAEFAPGLGARAQPTDSLNVRG